MSSTSDYKTYKTTGELPPLPSAPVSAEYKVKHVLLWAILTFFGHAGAFFGCFFGIRGSDGSWPEAWWAFAFLVNAIIQFFVYLNQNPAVVVRHENSFEFKNYFGKTIGEPGPLPLYEAVAISNKGQAQIVRTDEHMANMKATHKFFAWCIGKHMTFDFEDVSKFASDHGLSLDGSAAPTKAAEVAA